jgi:elongator complex protein 1
LLSLKSLSANDSTCAIFSHGDIVQVERNLEAAEIQIVGSVDEGILACAWSPDEDIIAILAGNSSLLLMTSSFDLLSTVNFEEKDLSLSRQVNVGWGKLETQFKGKRAHALRDPTIPEKIDERRLHPSDLGEATISWRGDGAFLAVSSVDDQSRRTVRVLSREGELESVSEPVDGLLPTLSWRPSGNLIAGVQVWGDLAQVVFFERNGLRHGQFPLRESAAEIASHKSNISLSWSVDSNILSLAFPNKVQFWISKNYHWYLKQEVLLEEQPFAPAIPLIAWHPEKASIVVVTHGSAVHQLQLQSEVSFGPLSPPVDIGITAVIDGSKLHITPFRIANVPPPMAYQELDLSRPIIDCSFSKSGLHLAILLSNIITIYRWKSRKALPTHHLDIPFHFNGYARGVCFLGDDGIFLLHSTPDTDEIVWYDLKDEGKPAPLVCAKGNFCRIVSRSDYGSISYETSTGLVHEATIETNGVSSRQLDVGSSKPSVAISIAQVKEKV